MPDHKKIEKRNEQNRQLAPQQSQENGEAKMGVDQRIGPEIVAHILVKPRTPREHETGAATAESAIIPEIDANGVTGTEENGAIENRIGLTAIPVGNDSDGMMIAEIETGGQAVTIAGRDPIDDITAQIDHVGMTGPLIGTPAIPDIGKIMTETIGNGRVTEIDHGTENKETGTEDVQGKEPRGNEGLALKISEKTGGNSSLEEIRRIEIPPGITTQSQIKAQRERGHDPRNGL